MDNFCTFNKASFDIIYSRFTFHSITNEDHEIFLDSIKPNSFLCIETRSDKGINDARYHGDNHYRNFTNKEYLYNLLLKYKFEIILFEESDNVAIYKTEIQFVFVLLQNVNIIKKYLNFYLEYTSWRLSNEME
jgi:hypothetical protein